MDPQHTRHDASPHDLEAVIVTHELDTRPCHEPDYAAENRALLALTQSLAETPAQFFTHLVDAVLPLAGAGSAGISLLNEQEKRFVWPALAGALSSHLGGGPPSDFSPCGTVLELRRPVLFRRPERHFTYLASLDPPLEEALLVPFSLNGRPVGTIWAIIHEERKHFDAEHCRLLEGLSNFAAAAYRTLASAGVLDPLLNMRPAVPVEVR